MDIEEKFKLLATEIESASQIAREYFDSEDFSNEQKEDGSVVTRVDQAIESAIRNFIDREFPDDAIVGEEEAEKDGTSGYVWHIDPIDGTDNFLRKIPFCAVSVARLGDTPEDSFAIVHNPITSHTFASLKENGSFENEYSVNVTPEPLGGKYVITIGRGSKASWMKSAKYTLMKTVSEKFGSCLSYNCTALELAYLSAGRVDAYLTFGLNTYDYAAGLYLVKAAGGCISVYEDGGWRIWEGSIKDLCDVHGKIIFASHEAVHTNIRDFIGNPQQWAD